MTVLRAKPKGLHRRWGRAQANRGASTLSISNATWTAVPYTTENYDTDDIWEGVTNPSRFLTPSWCTLAQYGGHVYYEGNTAGHRIATMRLNGSEPQGRGQSRLDMPDATWTTHNFWSSPIICSTPGTDYFETYTYQDSGAARNLAAAINWGCLIVVGSA